MGCGVEVCSCAQIVLTIGQKLTVKDVFFLQNVEASLNDDFKPNVGDRYVNRSAPAVGCGVKFCSCVLTVLTIV